MPSAFDYETIMNNAFQNLGTITANAALKKKRITDLLAEYTVDSKKGRDKSHLANRENASGRGLLQSGQSLKTIDETNAEYDSALAKAESAATNDTVGVDSEVSAAQGAYDSAKVNWTGAKTLEEEAAKAAKKKEDEDKAKAIADAAAASISTPAGPSAAVDGGPVDFLTWHASLSPEDKVSFDAAYPAPKPVVAKPKAPAKPKVVVPVKPKVPAGYGKKFF